MRLATLFTAVALLVAGSTLAPAAHADEELVSFDTCSAVLDFAEGGAGLNSWPAWSESESSSLSLRAGRQQPDPNIKVDLDDLIQDDSAVVEESASESGTAVSAPASAKADAGGAASKDDVSGTNTQEEGIDEPDLFKSDGRLLFVIAGSELRVVTARTDVPRAIARLPLDIAGGELLMADDKLLVLGAVPDRRSREVDGETYRSPKYPYATRLIEIDISDRTEPRVLRTLDAPGELIATRQTGSTVRVVVNTLVDEGYEYDEDDGSYDDVDLELNEVLPSTKLKSAVTGDRYSRRMAPCDQVERPAGFSGNDLVSIFTFDLGRGLVGIRREALMANAQVIYASPTTLYVASGRYVDWQLERGLPDDTYTDVHAFDLTTPGQTNYAGTGHVLGIPLNKYAFSEYGGDLRVATTTEPGWVKSEVETAQEAQCDELYGDAAEEEDDDYDEYEYDCEDYDEYVPSSIPVDNRVTVLHREGSVLAQKGLVEGIGRGGTIDAVRFDGPRGYVASSNYEEKDAPFTTLDLEDPAAPKAVGTLRVPGYSSYLHPLGDGLVLAVGQDRSETASEDSDEEWVGGVVSLFDVSDPASPKRLAKRNLGPGYSGAEYDPHAFLWWPRRKLVLLPYTGWKDVPDYYDYWGWEGTGELIGLTATRGSGSNLKEIARLTHGPDWDHPDVVRGVVFGDRLLSISEIGIGTSKVSDLSPLGYLPFTPYEQDLAPAKKCGVPGTTPSGTTPVGTTPSGTTPGTTPAGTTPATPAATTPKAARAQATTSAGTAPDAPASTSPGATTPGGTTPAGTTPAKPTPVPAIPWAAPWTTDRCVTPPPSVAPTTPTTPGTTPAGTTPKPTTPGTTPGSAAAPTTP